MRLDKFLSHTGFGSRKEVKQLLKNRQVTLNGVIVKEGKASVDEKKDEICVNQRVVNYQKFIYFMLNKPKGVVSATQDNQHRTVVDLLSAKDRHHDVFPVGRLDKDTTGFLLLTNDGELAHHLLSPKKKVPKCYQALVSGVMTDSDQVAFKEGLDIGEEKRCLPADLEILNINLGKKQTVIRLEIMEGKFHQVKRMVKKVGKEVLELERLSMGGLSLDSKLKYGQYRELTKEEQAELFSKLSDKSQKK